MVDLLGMFRRRPAKRTTPGFARSRDDITALGDSFGDMLTRPMRDAPPIARETPINGLDLSKPPPGTEFTKEARRQVPKNPATDERPRPKARPAKPGKGSGHAKPQMLKRPGYLAVHSVEKSFGSRQVVRGVSIYV